MGPRIVAAIIDVVILAVVFVILAVLFGDFGSSSSGNGSSFNASLGTLGSLIFFVIVMGYYFVLESQTGQTIGKKVMNIRVTAVDGTLTGQKVAIRTILRIIDGLPFLYLLGVIVAAASSKNQRIGDMAAGTVVVRA